ncbi:MAG: hypothetical protein ACKVVP_18830, partial [Chloroflexota bacterium]
RDVLRGHLNGIFMADHGLGPAFSLVAGALTMVIGAQATLAIFGGTILLAAAVAGLEIITAVIGENLDSALTKSFGSARLGLAFRQSCLSQPIPSPIPDEADNLR